MKKLLYLLFLLIIQSTYSQDFKIDIKFDDKVDYLNTDSIYMRSFNPQSKKFEDLYTQKFTSTVTFKDNTPLEAGVYVIYLDSNILVEFLISDTKSQKFTVQCTDKDIIFINSPENTANRQYVQKIGNFRSKEAKLNETFRKLNESQLPRDQLQPQVDTILAEAKRINLEKREYQLEIAKEYQGTLLSSVIKASIEASLPPEELFKNRKALFEFMVTHVFEYYDWGDERMLNTPLSYAKMDYFIQLVSQMEPEHAFPFVMETLQESKQTQKSYYAFFDLLEKKFGYLTSSYRDELLYIEMLKDALQEKDLSEARKLRYTRELSIIDKNRVGERVADFNMLSGNGDTLTLYSISTDYTLIYFQNPDCPNCIEVREKMKTIEVINNVIDAQKLTVLTVYFEKNEEIWRRYLLNANPKYIHTWNFDHAIEEHYLFDVRIIPTMFLLDKDKKVIKKDLPSNEIESVMKKLF